jgi:hypothetical protein
MAASYLVGAVIRQAPAVKGYKMTEKNVRQWLAIRKSGIQINPETAEIDWFSDVPGFWFDAMANEEAVQNYYFVNPPANCDLCERAFAQEECFVDGRVKGAGACGFMCADCFAEYGVGLGLGIGQLYRRERGRPLAACSWRRVRRREGPLPWQGYYSHARLHNELPWFASIDESVRSNSVTLPPSGKPRVEAMRREKAGGKAAKTATPHDVKRRYIAKALVAASRRD